MGVKTNLVSKVKSKAKETVSKVKPKDRKEVKNMDEVTSKIRDYILNSYEKNGYEYAFKIAQAYMNDSTNTQRDLGVKDFATTVRGELSEIFLEVCIRDFVAKHKNTFYVKGLCIERKDGKPGFTELDLTLFTSKRIFLFECKSYSGKKRLIDEGTMVTERFAPFDVFKQNRMHLDNFRKHIDSARLKDLTAGKPYSISMFSFNNEDILDLRTEEWKLKFPLNLETTIQDWLEENANPSIEDLWDIKKVYSIVSVLEKSSEANFKKHLEISKARQAKRGTH